jgi:hypothetical protein
MKLRRDGIVIAIIVLLELFSLVSAQGSVYTWKEGDKYSWKTSGGYESYYYNESGTWDYHSFIIRNEVDVEILEIDSDDKILYLEESWYQPDSYYSDEPFKIQEVTQSFDLINNLHNKDINSLFTFDYEYDDVENRSYLNDIDTYQGENKIYVKYFCSANWSVINSLFQSLFSDSAIIDNVNGSDITFRDFLNNSTYLIMGLDNHSEALNLMTGTNHYWSASFNYSNHLEVHGPEIETFEVLETNATFILQYSEGGVLEKYLLRNFMSIHINDYYYQELNTMSYTLTKAKTGLLKIFIPATISGIVLIAIVILNANSRKRSKIK